MAKSRSRRDRERGGGISALAVVSGLLAAGFIGLIVWLWWADRAERLARQQARDTPAATAVVVPLETAQPEASPPEATRDTASEVEPAAPASAPAPVPASEEPSAARGEAAENPAPADQSAVPPPPASGGGEATAEAATEPASKAEGEAAEPGPTEVDPGAAAYRGPAAGGGTRTGPSRSGAGAGPGADPGNPEWPPAEIGRASCRERV